MANIDEDDEDIDEEDDTMEEIEPPKRKAIATLKVWGRRDRQFTVQSVFKDSCQQQKNKMLTVNVSEEAEESTGHELLGTRQQTATVTDYMERTVLPVKLPVSHTVPN